MEQEMWNDSHDLLEGSKDQIEELTVKYLQAQNKLKKTELEFEKAKEEFENISEIEFPELLETLGLTELTLSDGTKIKVKHDVYGSLPKDEERRKKAIEWLENNGCADIIKHEFVESFPRGSDVRLLNDLRKHLETLGISYTEKEDVHHSTLKATVRALQRDKKIVPLDILGLIEKPKTTVE